MARIDLKIFDNGAASDSLGFNFVKIRSFLLNLYCVDGGDYSRKKQKPHSQDGGFGPAKGE